MERKQSKDKHTNRLNESSKLYKANLDQILDERSDAQEVSSQRSHEMIHGT